MTSYRTGLSWATNAGSRSTRKSTTGALETMKNSMCARNCFIWPPSFKSFVLWLKTKTKSTLVSVPTCTHWCSCSTYLKMPNTAGPWLDTWELMSTSCTTFQAGKRTPLCSTPSLSSISLSSEISSEVLLNWFATPPTTILSESRTRLGTLTWAVTSSWL